MSWLRIDDGFAAHPKIAALTDRELRVWLRVLCYCARHQDPTVDGVTSQEIPGLNKALVDKLIELELLDPSGDDHEVHNWSDYQPKDLTGADRQARWRARRNAHRNAESNAPSNADVDAPDRYENVTLARAPAAPDPSRPVPNPSLETEEQDQEPSFLPTPTRDVEQEGMDFNGRAKTEADLVAERELNYEIPDVAFQDIPS